MTRKIMTEKNKKHKKKKKYITAIVILLILGLGVVVLWKFIFDKNPQEAQVITVLDSLDDYGYSLNDKDSQLFKTEYEELKKILLSDKIDEKEYATKVARLFVIDFYTLSTKLNKYDIGGNEYFYTDKKDMFEQKAIDTIYATVSDNTYGDRKQELAEIKSVETVSVEPTTYTLGNKKVDGYLVKLKMTYVKSMGYDDEASLVICKEEDGPRLSVVDFQPTLKPKYSTINKK